jgi:hypothetical protein
MKLMGYLGIALLLGGCAKGKQLGTDGADMPRISADQYNSLLSLSDVSLAQKALTQELGNCVLKNSNTPNCSSGDTYQVYLLGKDVYFPMMTTASTANGSACLEYVGSFARSALREGFCYQFSQ